MKTFAIVVLALIVAFGNCADPSKENEVNRK
jgi:hypothetical protein